MSLLRYVLAVAALLFVSHPTDAQFWPVRPLGAVISSVSYTGPGDCSGCAPLSWWFGLRAYSAATAGATPVVNICSESGGIDVTCEDEQTSASTGKIVLGTVGSTCASVTCTVKIWYDPTGNNFCSGAPCSYTQTTVANRASFLITGCPGSSAQPCAQFNGGQCYNSAGTVSTSVPFSGTAVADSTITTQVAILTTADQNIQLGLYSAGGDAYIFSSPDILNAAASSSALHAIQWTNNSASTSTLNVDGTSQTGTLGTDPFVQPVTIGSTYNNCVGDLFEGYIAEDGFVNSLFSSGNMSALVTNQRGFYGF